MFSESRFRLPKISTVKFSAEYIEHIENIVFPYDKYDYCLGSEHEQTSIFVSVNRGGKRTIFFVEKKFWTFCPFEPCI